MTKRKAKRKASPKATALPKGYEAIGGYSDSWIPEDQPVLQGRVTGEVKTVKMTIEGEKTTRRCLEFFDKESEMTLTIWESAALGNFFDLVKKQGPGGEFFIRYDGLGEAKPGQNPPKLFTVAAATAAF